MNDPSSHVHVTRDAQGQATGAAAWKESSNGPDGLAIALAPGQGIDTLLRLAQLAILDALSRGYTQGSFTIHDATLLAVLQQSFTLDAAPIGWVPATEFAPIGIDTGGRRPIAPSPGRSPSRPRTPTPPRRAPRQ